MDTAHLELLRELHDRGSLAAVARVTGRTPSAVSQQLRTAERDLGVTLVERAGRGLRLTAAGELLAEAAVGVAAELARVQARLDDLVSVPSGQVRLAALPSAAVVLVPPLLARLAATRVTLTLDDIDVSERGFPALADDADVVIGHSMSGPVPAGAERLACVPLLREPLDIALPRGHRLAGAATLQAADLAGEDWIGVPEGFPFDAVRLDIERRLSQPMRVVQRVRDNAVVEALVAAGQGVALLPRFSTRPSAAIVLRPLADVPSSRFVVAMCRPERAERAAVRVVLEALRAVAGRIAGDGSA